MTVSDVRSGLADTEGAPSQLVRAAQYMRMSTEHQRYSIDNQSAAIAEYAKLRDIEITRTYADRGKSGLRLQGRDALKRLIADVENGTPDFSAILVYDVSRWGRFQDADESAYYEHICKRAGVVVHYCAEQFENDGSISSTIVKAIKRVMAGEFSRELSVKVFAGKCRIVERGFSQGVSAAYGLRRLLIDEERRPKGELTHGQRKSLHTDRVILIPGPAAEVAMVNRIFSMFVHEGKTEAQIAAILNAEGVVNVRGRSWIRPTVRVLLQSEKYIGNNIFNRRSFKLKKTRIFNREELWVRADGVFEPIVDPKTFHAAQQIILERSRRLTDAEMLERLKQLLHERGRLSKFIIDEAEGVPSCNAYVGHFGRLLRAYELIGYVPDRNYRFKEAVKARRIVRPDLVRNIIFGIEQLGGSVRFDEANDLLIINGEFTASISFAWRSVNRPQWRAWLQMPSRPDVIVAVRMDPENRHPIDCYLLTERGAPLRMVRSGRRHFTTLDDDRFRSLDVFYRLCARTAIDGIDLGRETPITALAQSGLPLLVNVLRRLFSDEHFVTLLRAETVKTVPIRSRSV